MVFGNDGRHVESSTNGGIARFRDERFAMNGRAGLVLSGIKASKGDELADIVKGSQGAAFGHQFGSTQRTEARDGINQVALALQVGEVVDMVLNGGFELVDLG